jgi:fructokinase
VLKVKKVLTIGEALIDFSPASVGRLSEVSSFTRACGGAPANVAAAVAKLGGRSGVITKLGKDGFGDYIFRTLEEAGVETSSILRTDHAGTSLAFVSLHEDGGREFSFYRNPGADMLYEPNELKSEVFSDLSSLHFCSVDLVECPMKETHRAAISLARERGAIISFDPNIRLPLWKYAEDCIATVREFLPMADVIKLSDEECEMVTGQKDPKGAAETLLKRGCQLVLVSLGSQGALLYTAQGRAVFCPSIPCRAVDTTGAGDAFIGSFLFQLARDGLSVQELASLSEKKMTQYLTFSNAYAAAGVEKYGAIPAYPSQDEFQCFLQKKQICLS